MAIVGSEDGRCPRAKGGGQSLEAEKARNGLSPKASRRGT